MVCFQILCFAILVICASAIDLKDISWAKHHNNKELYEILLAVNKNCPNFTEIYNLKYHDAHGEELDSTALKNKLYVIRFGKSAPGRPKFKWVGNMHGNEVVGRELLLRLAVTLCQKYLATEDPNSREWRALIESMELHIMPTMNPDGWQIANNASIAGSKNVLKGRRNGNNADLNRDFPDLDSLEFRLEKLGGPSDHLMRNYNFACSRQPETCMVMEWILRNNFVLSANLHGGDKVANYPYDESRRPNRNDYSACPDDQLFKQLASIYSWANHKMSERPNACEGGRNEFVDGITNGGKWYSVSGGMQDFNYLGSNCFEITVELGCKKYPPAAELPRYWRENENSMLRYMVSVHFGIKGQITSNGRPVGADATVVVHELMPSGYARLIRHNVTSGNDGFFYRLLSDGLYAVTVYHGDCTPVRKCVLVDNTVNWKRLSAERLDFHLSMGSGSQEVEVDESCYIGGEDSDEFAEEQ